MNFDESNHVVVSVIIPLVFIRGPVLDCISSWTKKQSFPRAKYEVILVSPGLPDHKLTAPRSCLTERDTLIVERSTNLYRLYKAGANKARGDILMFCESHVQGTSGCISAIVSQMEKSQYEGLSCRSVSPPEKHMAKMEGMLFAEEQAVWSREGHWRKVNERGFAIRRATYFEFGGFDDRYEWFAGRAFAIALNRAGVKLGFAREAVVCHHNMTDFRDLHEGVRSFTYGESLYRLEQHRPYCKHYIGDSTEIAECRRLSPEFQRLRARFFWHFCRAGFRHSFGHTAEHRYRSGLPCSFSYTLQSLLVMVHPRLPFLTVLISAWIGAILTRTRITFWRLFNEQRCYRAFREYWHEKLVRFYKLKNVMSLLENPGTQRFERHMISVQHENPEQTTGLALNFCELDDSRLIEFHEVETHQGRAFRWTSPQACVAVSIQAGPYTVELEVLDVRSLGDDLNLSVYFDGNKLPLRATGRDLLVFELCKAQFKHRLDWHDLIIECSDLPAGKKNAEESRALGLPLVSIRFCEVRNAPVNADLAHQVPTS